MVGTLKQAVIRNVAEIFGEAKIIRKFLHSV
jgi:hypothetical protein